MISASHKDIIIKTASRYNVSAVYLFGSSLQDEAHAQDLDLGVLGVPRAMFLDFYADLVKALSKPTLFNRLVLRDGIKIYC